MSALWRLIARNVLPMVLLVWLVFVAIDSLFMVLGELDEIGIGRYNFDTILYYVLLTLPRRAYQVFVYAALIGTLLGLGQLAANSELTALRAVGVSKLKIVLVTLATVGLLAAVTLVLAEAWGSTGDRLAESAVATAKQRGLGVGAHSGLWIKDGTSFINATNVLANEGRPTELWGLSIYEFDADGELIRVATAARASHRPQGGWVLYDLVERRLAADGAETHRFAELPWATTIEPEQIAARALRPRQMSVVELIGNIRFAERNALDPLPFQSALWYRLSYPVAILAILLAALPFAFSNLRSGGAGKRLFIGMLIGVAFFFLQRTSANLFETYRWALWAGYLAPPLVMALFGLWLLRRV